VATTDPEPATRRLMVGGLVLVAVSGVGVAGYLAAGWSLLDSLYMVVITVFAVGYGEVRDLDPTLRWFTIVLIVSGCSSLIYIMGAFFR
jgi:voltage-gated potassium channel